MTTGLGDARLVQAPMAGGPSTPALAAAVTNAGGFGFLAAGYRSTDELTEQIEVTRTLTDGPFGVNLFVPSPTPASKAAVEAYARELAPLAAAAAVELGTPRFDDDQFDAKLRVVATLRPAVVSFAFGCPDPGTVRDLRARDIAVWITVTDADEGQVAALAGADAVVVQGAEAGGHRGSFADDDDAPQPLLDLLAEVGERLAGLAGRAADAGVVAAGGLHTAAQIASALEAGAVAAQLGTAFLLCPEAGTNRAHRAAIRSSAPTTLTRAFSGRLARSVVNAWTEQFDAVAPSAYPEVHHLTTPLRAHGRAVDDANLVNLWAGAGHELARDLPAAELVTQLTAALAELGYSSSSRG